MEHRRAEEWREAEVLALKAERIDGAGGFEEAEGLVQSWAEAESLDIAEVLIQCWAEAFFGAEEDLCGGGSERLENHTVQSLS